MFLPVSVNKASSLRGLIFGNAIDNELLPRGLPRHSLSFLYGTGVDKMMNAVCANSVRTYDARAIYVDAANSADPYMIAKLMAHTKQDRAEKKVPLDSILIIRAFTCYQLYDIIAEQIPKKSDYLFVSGVDYLFSEQDNTKAEIERLETLMASELSSLASRFEFVVCSAKTWSEQFFLKSNVAIKFTEKKAILTKSDEMQFTEAFL